MSAIATMKRVVGKVSVKLKHKLEFAIIQVMGLIRTLESYLSFNEFYHIMDLVKSVNTPSGYSLSQNYPNPFNAETAISYQLPAVSELITDHSPLITLKVFNLLGQEVATLVNQVQEPGYYTVTWDASDMGSGIYFYRLTAGEFCEKLRSSMGDITDIYREIPADRTADRARNIKLGIEKYMER